jgi:PilZ domain
MAQVKCPKCARDFVRRISRSGLLEKFLSNFYVYPFKCQLCGYRFRFFQWRVRYIRVEEDRREYDRMAITFPLSFSGEGISGQGTLVNVSMGGCSFVTHADFAVGTIFEMKLQISTDVDPVTVSAAVVRSLYRGTVGVEFLQWQQSERQRLQLFVRSLLIEHGVELRSVRAAG